MPDLLSLLRRVVESVNSTRDLKTKLSGLTQMVRGGMAIDACSVYLWDDQGEHYSLMATAGLANESVGSVKLSKNQGLIALVGKREEPLNLADYTQHPNFHPVMALHEEDMHGMLAVPIIHSRKLLGVVCVHRKAVARFEDEEEAFLVTLSAQLAGIVAHAEATGQLAGMSLFGRAKASDIRFDGVVCSSGIAIGEAYLVAPAMTLESVRYSPAADICAEKSLFNTAIASVREELAQTRIRLKKELRPEEIALFDVYAGILDDHSLSAQVVEKIDQGEAATSALASTMHDCVLHFEKMEDKYLRERASDMRDLGQRILACMIDESSQREAPEGCVLVGEDISAAVFGQLNPQTIAGIVCLRGSANSHLAILARALNIPTVLGAQSLPWQELDGQELVVDGFRGHVYCKLSEERKSHFQILMDDEAKRANGLEALADLPAQTADGTSVKLLINTGLQTDVIRSLTSGADGVGLFRTEIPFMMSGQFPGEAEQAKIYRSQLESFHPRPVTMRTLDIGGDKSLDYFPIVEDNPFLGWRGLRVTLDHPEILMVQVRAMLRASLGLNNLRIMLPMVTSIGEVEEALALIHRAVYELNDEGASVEVPEIGVMIEVPSAVYLIEEMNTLVDFVSVGSNDLTQYLLAVDRNNPRVADIYDSMHPAVLKALKSIVVGCERSNVNLSICGELAGDPLGAIALLGLGYRDFSMSSANLLRVKSVFRQIEVNWAEEMANKLLRLDDPKIIRSTLKLALKKVGVTPESLGLLPSA